MGLGLSKDADNPNPSDSDSCTGSGTCTYVKKKICYYYGYCHLQQRYCSIKGSILHHDYLNHTVYDYLHVIIRGPNSCLTCKGNCSSWYTSI